VNEKRLVSCTPAGCLLAILFATNWAKAQLAPNGSPIATSHYAVDLYQGNVLASTRVIGMGGAYVAIAEGVEGSFYNPAAPAVRVSWSKNHVDYDLGFGMTFPGTLRSSDYFNSGADRTNLATSSSAQFVFMDAEAHLQIGPWGFGSGLALQQYGLNRDTVATSSAQPNQLRAQIYVVLLQAARATANGQLVVGVGLRPTGMNVLDLNPSANQPSTLFSTAGMGYSAGFLWRPTDAAFRVGASFTSAVKTIASSSSAIHTDGSGNRVLVPDSVDQMYLPERVGLPWELNFGVATQLGARPFNPRWIDPLELTIATRRQIEWRKLERERLYRETLAKARSQGKDLVALTALLDAEEEALTAADNAELDAAYARAKLELRERYRKMGRWYILISTSMRVAGPVEAAVGIESFLQRVVDRSGRRAVVSPHVGVESEVISGWLKLRAGAYGEPTRFDNARSAPRLHTTLGFEEKLFNWDVFGLYGNGTSWRVQGAVDMSERYFGFGGSIGVWN